MRISVRRVVRRPGVRRYANKELALVAAAALVPVALSVAQYPAFGAQVVGRFASVPCPVPMVLAEPPAPAESVNPPGFVVVVICVPLKEDI